MSTPTPPPTSAPSPAPAPSTTPGANITHDPEHIANWLRIDAQITSSGQPGEEEIAQIAQTGARYVINLALHSHERALPAEAQSVAASGMTYIHIPVEFTAPTEDDYAQFCAAMQRVGDARVHVHCIINARVSAFLYRYRREYQGVDETTARAMMEKLWRPGGVWAAFIGDTASIDEPHRGPRGSE